MPAQDFMGLARELQMRMMAGPRAVPKFDRRAAAQQEAMTKLLRPPPGMGINNSQVKMADPLGQQLRAQAANAAQDVNELSPGLDPFTVTGRKPGPPPDATLASNNGLPPSDPSSPGGIPPSVDPGAASLFDNMSPEQIQKVLEMGGLHEQLLKARAMRDKAAPEGRYVSGGRMYVAGSPLEHVVNTVGNIKGGRDVKKTQQELSNRRKIILDALRGTPQFEALASSTEVELPRPGVFNA